MKICSHAETEARTFLLVCEHEKIFDSTHRLWFQITGNWLNVYEKIFESTHGLWFPITGNWLNVYEKIFWVYTWTVTESQVTDWMCTRKFFIVYTWTVTESQVTDWMCTRKLFIVYPRAVTLDSPVTDQVCMKGTYGLCGNRPNVTCRQPNNMITHGWETV
jgi:hypothetical protein